MIACLILLLKIAEGDAVNLTSAVAEILKSVLAISRLRLLVRSGVHAILGLRLLTFFMLIALQQEREKACIKA